MKTKRIYQAPLTEIISTQVDYLIADATAKITGNSLTGIENGGPEDGTGGHTPQVKGYDDNFAVWDEDE
jgi:hypothetical protein